MSFEEWLQAIKDELKSMPGNPATLSRRANQTMRYWYDKLETPEDIALRIWETKNNFTLHIG